MEDSQFETLKPSQTHFNFHPHRRRPLKSKTFCTFVQILSHCSNHSRAVEAVPEEPKLDNRRSELVQVIGRDELVGHNHIESENLLVGKELLVDETREVVGRTDNCSTELAQIAGHDESVDDNPMESENLLVDDNREIMGSQVEGLSNSQMEIDGLDHMNLVEGNKELAHDNNIKFDNPLAGKDHYGSNDVELIDNQEDQFKFPELDMEEFGPLDGDMIAGTSKSNEDKGKKSPLVEIDEGEIQSKEKELEKLLSSSHRSSADEKEIEEGEIEGDAGGVYGDLMDFLLEDDTSLEEQRVKMGQISQGIVIDKEELTADELQRGYEEKIDNVSKSTEDELRESNINMVESKSKTARNKKPASQAKESNGPENSLENLALPSGFLGRNETENKVTAFTQEDTGTKSKKRRRDPQTAGKKEKEKDAGTKSKKSRRDPQTAGKKEKEKRKYRIRRAEENRKAGVKRMTIPPRVPKPKKVEICRHHLYGRCNEGEKCKFSHDAVPLTKSVPCNHFARNSCMKGDKCQYDHQLSKYPCNNYLTKGSCSRGAACMFSHEKMEVKESGPTASHVLKPELKSVSSPSNSIPKQQLNSNDTSHRNPNAKSSSVGISPCKSSKQNAAPAPKGISFRSNGYLSRGNQAVDNVAKTGNQTVHSASSDLVQKSDEVPKTTPAVARQGINFLSFGKPPSNDLTKNPSIFPFNRDQGMGKTLPVVAPQGIKTPSSDKSQSDSFPTDKKQANPIPKEDSAVSISPSLGKLGGEGRITSTSSSLSQKVLLSSTPSSAHKGFRSMMAFAAKMDRSVGVSMETGSSSQIKSTKASTILDFLHGDRNKSKQ
ncbi:hypothetical protein LguiB_018608 [Lonicera macranthoides]